MFSGSSVVASCTRATKLPQLLCFLDTMSRKKMSRPENLA